MDLKKTAQETLDACARGSYISRDGSRVEFADQLAACLAGTREYHPDELYHLVAQAPRSVNAAATTFAVTRETTLQGAARLAASGIDRRIGVLNFASARHPGGGFLGGARAQEESLARGSGLFPSLLRCPDFYAFHRAQATTLYSDRMILSPGCPVIRDDDGAWLPQPYLVDFITSAAPNAGAIMRNEPEHREKITPTVMERAGKVLALAAHAQCDTLVLGAWGCGVFQNRPATVAEAFYHYLGPEGQNSQQFRHVLFAIADSSREGLVYRAFANQFAGLL
ncbi:MAG TPA: TIGR02452 family protein [Ktedonobacterales bacterium]